MGSLVGNYSVLFRCWYCQLCSGESLVFYRGLMHCQSGLRWRAPGFLPGHAVGAMLGKGWYALWVHLLLCFFVWICFGPFWSLVKLKNSLGHLKLAGRTCNDVWFVHGSLSVDLLVEVCSRAAATAVSRHNTTTTTTTTTTVKKKTWKVETWTMRKNVHVQTANWRWTQNVL